MKRPGIMTLFSFIDFAGHLYEHDNGPWSIDLIVKSIRREIRGGEFSNLRVRRTRRCTTLNT